VAKTIRRINPEALNEPPSYTQVVEVSGPVRTVHIAGQLGIDRDGEVVGEPGEFRAQAVQAFDNLKAALAAVGADFEDVVKVNTYLADISHLPILREVRAGYLPADALPASTTIAVSGFARPTALLEIEAVAVLPLPEPRGKPQGTRGAARSGRAAKAKASRPKTSAKSTSAKSTSAKSKRVKTRRTRR
jgi:enamine deaminase RidA (YjgF/YER057c/UK114 family)